MAETQKKLPMVISVPHGGMLIPAQLRKKCIMREEEIVMDNDTLAQELFDFDHLVEAYVKTDIARCVLDMNRDKHDLPPHNPDGVVKTHSVNQEQIWESATGISAQEIKQVIADYYEPYHLKLENAAQNPKVVLGIDCHTMLDTGPTSEGGKWEKRPLFCISNRGSTSGQRLQEPITAPAEMMMKLKYLLESQFENWLKIDVHNHNDTAVDDGSARPLVSINDPFFGGYITHYHGHQGHIPWIQLEINRSVYLPASFNPSFPPDESGVIKMRDIRNRLYVVFRELVNL